MEATLSSVQSKTEFLETPEGKSLFGSQNALDWFERINRKSLVQAGVLIKVRRRWHRIRPAYDLKVIEIAQALAQEDLEK